MLTLSGVPKTSDFVRILGLQTSQKATRIDLEQRVSKFGIYLEVQVQGTAHVHILRCLVGTIFAKMDATMSDGSSLSSSSHNETESSSSEEETGEDDEVTRKRARYSCTFRPESNSFKWAKSSRKGPSFAFCTVCSCDISVAYGGKKDLKRHELTGVHQSAGMSVKATRSLTGYFTNASGPKREQAVVEAEVNFSYFIGEHHLALALADYCSRLFPSLFPSLFPDSAVAKAFKCGRTKATAIMKVVAQEVIEDLSRLEESRFFSVRSDESADITVQQQCAIMLQFFDNNDGEV